ncbi:hypothetical protein QBC38DRAFT_223042 [Podospora fimiseda]|uniref:WSC domain-containing protein n=1 Tax=Podospora fimiseda TaxID=252190 RepID=A0AAN7H7Z7_9PEZI|nr:hypothetical protein QBC38DRAFT_223042 [Podospora fimiseda]
MFKSTLFILATAGAGVVLASPQATETGFSSSVGPSGTPTPEIPFSSSQWKHLGCYLPNDHNKTGDIGVQMFTTTLPFNSIGTCAEKCNLLGANLYPWAALTAGNVCHCGQEFTNKKAENQSLCNIPCPGYALDICGGVVALDVYENEAAVAYHKDKGTYSTKTVPFSGAPTPAPSNGTSSTGGVGASQTSGRPQQTGAAGKLGVGMAGVLVAGAGLLIL